MVQPQKPPISIRLGDERLARIDAYAADHHLSRHLAILLMLDEGYRSLTKAAPLPAPAAAKVKPAPKAEPIAKSAFKSRLKGEWKAP